MNTAPVTWCGWMENAPGRPSIELWNLTGPIPEGKGYGDTVSRNTLERWGYTVPPAPVPDPYLHAAA